MRVTRLSFLAILLVYFFSVSVTVATHIPKDEEYTIPILLQRERFEILNQLKDIDVKQLPPTLLQTLTLRDNHEAVNWLLDRGLVISELGDGHNYTLLYDQVLRAVKSFEKKASALEWLQFLIDKGANVNSTYEGELLLSTLLMKGYKEAAIILIKNNADLKLVSSDGKTPLQLIQESNDIELINLIPRKQNPQIQRAKQKYW